MNLKTHGIDLGDTDMTKLDHVLEFFKKITFYYDINSHYRRLRRSISWAIFMYNNYDFDHSYMYKVIHKKLTAMAASMKDSHIVEGERISTLDNMYNALHCLDDLIDDDFARKEHDDHEKEYGPLEFQFEEIGKKKAYSKLNFKRDKTLTKARKKQEKLDFYQIGELEYKRKLQTKKQLFTLMDKHIEEWWD